MGKSGKLSNEDLDYIRARIIAGDTRTALAIELNVDHTVVSYHADKMGLRKKTKNFKTRYQWQEIQAFYDEGHSMHECIEKFGIGRSSWWEASRLGRIKIRPREQVKRFIPLEDILSGRATIDRAALKKKLRKHGMDSDKCQICGIADWLGKPLVLQLDHINGINNDHRQENIRWLCPNCHSQTPTFAGRNVKKKRNAHS